MYPIKFKNLYYEKIWGTKKFVIPRNNIPEGKVGESWDMACHSNGMSVIKNGKYQGIKLDELIRRKGKDLLGTKISEDEFPLLLKIIDTSEELSVQVHPSDEYEALKKGEMGKTEVWYILDAKEDATIIVGVDNCTPEEFEKAVDENKLENCMNKIKVKKGDVYYIQSGLIHSIGRGISLVEIQQNSDLTYRVYDYGRDRELHIDKALEVIDFDIQGKKSNGLKVEYDNYNKTYYCLNRHFSLELYNINGNVLETSDEERFFVFTCVEGRGKIKYNDGEEEINLGDTIFIPAGLGEYELIGDLKLLKSYVPDVPKVEKEILRNIS